MSDVPASEEGEVETGDQSAPVLTQELADALLPGVIAEIEGYTTEQIGRLVTARKWWNEMGAVFVLPNGREYVMTPVLNEGELQVEVRRIYRHPSTGAYRFSARIDRPGVQGTMPTDAERFEFVDDWGYPQAVLNAAARVRAVYHHEGVGDQLLGDEERQQLKEDVNRTLLEIRKAVRRAFPGDVPAHMYWPNQFTVEFKADSGASYRVHARRHGRQVTVQIVSLDADGREVPVKKCSLSDLATLEGQYRADRFVRDFLSDRRLNWLGWSLRTEYMGTEEKGIIDLANEDIIADTNLAAAHLASAVKSALPPEAAQPDVPYSFSTPYHFPSGRGYLVVAEREGGTNAVRVFRLLGHSGPIVPGGEYDALQLTDPSVFEGLSDPHTRAICREFAADFLDDNVARALAGTLRGQYNVWQAKVGPPAQAHRDLMSAIRGALPEQALQSGGVPFSLKVPYTSPEGHRYEVVALRLNAATSLRIIRVRDHPDPEKRRQDMGDPRLLEAIDHPEIQSYCNEFAADFGNVDALRQLATSVSSAYGEWHSKVVACRLTRVSHGNGTTIGWIAMNPRADGAAQLVKDTVQLTGSTHNFAQLVF